MQVRPLIAVETVIEAHGRSRVDYAVKTRSQFKTRSYATDVEILIPVRRLHMCACACALCAPTRAQPL
ncbi:MAG: hypothetical protein EOO65_04110 [Methanosarcinales archaeon]|nr:MAG: hypothetical protein EOO65_04110 [Methanosarcinales archaeon]